MDATMTTPDTRSKDPLLVIAKGILWFILGVMAFAGIIVAICIPGVIIFGGEFTGAAELGPLPLNTRLLCALLLAGVAGLLYLAWRFFRAMLAIVHSVGEGDPFIPDNADRLTAMAWITLAINVGIMPIAALGDYVATIAGAEDTSVAADVEFGGVILILTLFILARVFRQGAAMRADLEGTV